MPAPLCIITQPPPQRLTAPLPFNIPVKPRNTETKQKQMREKPLPHPNANHRKIPRNSQISTKILTP
ncbi:hypothetical protein HMPREF9080_00384 [Cardiobacterium valvarum F0432]|uniref:Uncharacterized protein n=1 Tax=Cardiobacterium valvarum F0432 TaxID=797473 RepID=G9ZCA7_9GAMM|nr:hypothetical protein HMPREF9080_00384 [Cardiobacterium valvarum F0432]